MRLKLQILVVAMFAVASLGILSINTPTGAALEDLTNQDATRMGLTGLKDKVNRNNSQIETNLAGQITGGFSLTNEFVKKTVTNGVMDITITNTHASILTITNTLVTGITTNILQLLVPGGGTNSLVFTNGIFKGVTTD